MLGKMNGYHNYSGEQMLYETGLLAALSVGGQGVIDGFMIQGGDFEMNSGSGGYAAKWYGYCNGQTTDSNGESYTAETCQINQWSLPGEHENGLKHKGGSLAAAHAGLNTDGSQFYIVPSDSAPTWLDWNEGKDCSQESCQPHPAQSEQREYLLPSLRFQPAE